MQSKHKQTNIQNALKFDTTIQYMYNLFEPLFHWHQDKIFQNAEFKFFQEKLLLFFVKKQSWLVR